MDDNKYGLIAASIVAVGLVVVAVALATRSPQAPSVTVGGDTNPAPVVVSGNSQAPAMATPVVKEGMFGGTTSLDTLNLKDSLQISGTTVIGSERSVSTTNLYVSGNVTGNLPSVYVAAMSSSATTTACTFAPPEDGTNRTILGMWVEDTGSASSLGSVTWQAATGSTQYALASTATKGVNTFVTRSTVTQITTTSTPQLTGYLQQRTSDYVNFISSTTTNSGYCFLLAR